MTKVTKCSCANSQQDAIHGPNNRVHNSTLKKVGDKKLIRCTSCGAEKVN
jgi:hypothetical protein